MAHYTETELNRMSRTDLLEVIRGINEVLREGQIEVKGKTRSVLVEDILEFQEEKGAFPLGGKD